MHRDAGGIAAERRHAKPDKIRPFEKAIRFPRPVRFIPSVSSVVSRPHSAMHSTELVYLCIVLALLVIPKALQRFRIPAPLTTFVFGIAGGLAVENMAHDPTLALLSTLGIASLFLFAGLEIELAAFHRGRWQLLGYLLVRVAALAAFTAGGMHFVGMPWQAAALLALALLTPSTGFILDTLAQQGLNENERFWVASKAVAGEILALLMLFVVLQSDSMSGLAMSATALAAMLAVLPFLFIMFGRFLLPYAPGSEFSLLVMVGLIAAYLTKQLGVYYLVGAFLAGFVARMLRERMPLLASDDNLRAVRLFASFFVPFYFFHSGLAIPAEAFQWRSLLLGLAISAVVLPCRIGFQWLHRRLVFEESRASSLRVSMALAPTLIFTLVLAGILHDRYAIPDPLYGALLVYAALSTALPSLLAKSRPGQAAPVAQADEPVPAEQR
jgi:Kef-type K+ transport system membrane component KefB